MIPIPALVSGKLAIGAGIAGLVVLLAVGAWGSFMLIERNVARAKVVSLTSDLEKEQKKVRNWSTKFGDLKKFSDEQTKAIVDLVDAQQAAELKQAAERAAAAAKAQPHKDKARVIFEYRPPPGKDPAEETRLYIDDLLRRERAGAVP